MSLLELVVELRNHALHGSFQVQEVDEQARVVELQSFNRHLDLEIMPVHVLAGALCEFPQRVSRGKESLFYGITSNMIEASFYILSLRGEAVIWQTVKESLAHNESS